MSAEILESPKVALSTIRLMVSRLNGEIGPGTVSMITSNAGLFKSLEWAQAGSETPSHDEELRILKLHEVWAALSAYNPDKAFNWLLMLNPLIKGKTPARAIKDNMFDDVFLAAQSFITSYNK